MGICLSVPHLPPVGLSGTVEDPQDTRPFVWKVDRTCFCYQIPHSLPHGADTPLSRSEDTPIYEQTRANRLWDLPTPGQLSEEKIILSSPFPPGGQAPGALTERLGEAVSCRRKGEGREPVTSLAPSALLSGAGTSDSCEGGTGGPPHLSAPRAEQPRAHRHRTAKRSHPWRGSHQSQGHGSKEEMELRGARQCADTPVPGKFSKLDIPTEKMKPASCPRVQPLVPEVTLGGGSWSLSLGVPHPCGDQ